MKSSEMARAVDRAPRVRDLHAALVEIVGVINRPQVDEMMVREAGISLDRALFPLLVRIGRSGPIGVVELADRVGRDYTTVSRQVAKLEALGLVRRQAALRDRRVREAAITAHGKAMTDAVDLARDRIGLATFSDWNDTDFDEMVRLVRRLADAFSALTAFGTGRPSARHDSPHLQHDRIPEP